MAATSREPGTRTRSRRRAASAITSHDVARAVGVSQSTVSRALRDDPRISSLTRERVLAVAAELGYVPSEIGRSLVTRTSRTIGIVVTDLSSVFYPYIVGPLHDEITEHDYRMVLFTEPVDSAIPDDSQAVKPLLDRLLDRSIDGVVLTTSTTDGRIPGDLIRRGVPFSFLTRFVDGIGADSAVVDNSLGASLAAAEAIRLGHRHIGAILGPANTSTGRDRERGLRATLTAAGLALADEATRRGSFSFEVGHAAMTELMGLPAPPTVVLCSNDTVAIGAFNAATALGLRVPQDVSLVGFDDLPMAAWEAFSLTTIHQPMEEMARTAARLLIARIESPTEIERAQQVVFEPRLVLRRTLAAPRPG